MSRGYLIVSAQFAVWLKPESGAIKIRLTACTFSNGCVKTVFRRRPDDAKGIVYLGTPFLYLM